MGADPSARELPVPPLEMRELVGPTDAAAFDNPSGDLVFPDLAPDSYESVLDFGCGCGRVARQLIQQQPRPRSYVGADLHRGMIEWCRRNLEPHAPGFRFVHHDIEQPEFNPGGTSRVLPLPAADSSISLMVAISVFTHTFQDQAVHYLREAARVLRPGGVLLSTWFVFDKRDFPMMQEEQNSLFINERSPWNAVIFDRSWLTGTLEEIGLTITRINPPEVRGFQWHLFIEPSRPGLSPLEFPADEAPQGVMRAPGGPQNPSTVGLDTEP